MPVSENYALWSADAVDREGEAIYARLRPTLEAEIGNRFVAIHVPTGDYTVDRSTARAMRAIRQRHEHGQLFLRKIGSEPEYGLAARALAGEMSAAAHVK